MAEIDTELRAAIIAFFRGSGEVGPFPNDAAFVQVVDAIIRKNRGGLQETFLMLREQLGRYPTFEELSQGAPGMGMGIAPDIK